MTLQLYISQQLTIYVGKFISYQVGSDTLHDHITCFIVIKGSVHGAGAWLTGNSFFQIRILRLETEQEGHFPVDI